MAKRLQRAKTMDVQERIYGVVRVIAISVFVILCVYPFWYIFVYSISDPGLARTGIWLLSKGFSLEGYRQLLARDDIGPAFVVSIARTVVGTVITIFFTSMLAFLVTRREMIGRKFVYRYVIITMYIGAGLIPWYLTMKTYHLDNTFLLYVLPGAVNAYYMILIKTYIEQLPESLEEAAQMEGAGFFGIFFRIILPLSKPILATCTVYCAVGQWNSWSDNFFLVRNPRLQTVQLILRNYLQSADKVAQAMKSGRFVSDTDLAGAITPQSVQMVALMVTTIPIILVYPFAQKYFTKGIMMGAIKG